MIDIILQRKLHNVNFTKMGMAVKLGVYGRTKLIACRRSCSQSERTNVAAQTPRLESNAGVTANN